MAKVIAPLMSIEASGTIAHSMTYMSLNGQHVVRRWNPVRKSNTMEQLKERYRMKRATETWQTESSTVTGNWDTYAKIHNLNKTGFNLYVGAFIDYMISNSDTIPVSRATPPGMS